MAYLFKDFDEKERITHLETEITRLQELCRNNFGVIADLKKENEKLNEIQLELKETTSDLAYSLAECPWWATEDQGPTLEAFRVLLTYTKNIQYILQLPIFFDPMEQLESYGLSREKALRYLRMRYSRKGVKSFKCPKCKKDFTTEERRRKHLEFHSNLKKKLHCSQCNKYIQSFQSFKSHLQSHQFMNQMMAYPTIRFQLSEDPLLKDTHSNVPVKHSPLTNPTISDFGIVKRSVDLDNDLDHDLDHQPFRAENSTLKSVNSQPIEEKMDCEVLEIIPEKSVTESEKVERGNQKIGEKNDELTQNIREKGQEGSQRYVT